VKPVHIILKLYSENTFYCFKLANINRFVEIALLNADALTPSRTFYLQDLSGSYDITSTINPWFGLRPRCISVISRPPQYAYLLLRSYYFFSVNNFSQVL
jgi:hypothetical protein